MACCTRGTGATATTWARSPCRRRGGYGRTALVLRGGWLIRRRSSASAARRGALPPRMPPTPRTRLGSRQRTAARGDGGRGQGGWSAATGAGAAGRQCRFQVGWIPRACQTRQPHPGVTFTIPRGRGLLLPLPLPLRWGQRWTRPCRRTRCPVVSAAAGWAAQGTARGPNHASLNRAPCTFRGRRRRSGQRATPPIGRCGRRSGSSNNTRSTRNRSRTSTSNLTGRGNGDGSTRACLRRMPCCIRPPNMTRPRDRPRGPRTRRSSRTRWGAWRGEEEMVRSVAGRAGRPRRRRVRRYLLTWAVRVAWAQRGVHGAPRRQRRRRRRIRRARGRALGRWFR